MLIESQELYEALKTVAPAISKGPLPILSHVLMNAVTDTCLELVTSDLETGIKTHVECQDASGFSICLPHRQLTDLVMTLQGVVEITQDDSWRAKLNDGTEFHLAGMDPADYPVWPNDEPDNFKPVAVSQFLGDLGEVLHAAARDDSRFNLNCLQMDGQAQRLMATDGDRLSIQAVTWLPEIEPRLVPKDGLTRAIKVLKTSKMKDIFIGADNRNLWIKDQNTSILIRTVDGEFPKWDHAGNPDDLPAVTFPRDAIKKAVKLTRIMLDARNPKVKLHFRPFRTEFYSEHETAYGIESAKHTIECFVPPEMQGTEIYLNHVYLSQALAHAPAIVPLRVLNGYTFVGNEVVMQMKA